MDLIAYCKENYEYIALQNAIRFNGVVDVYRNKKTGKISVFVLPEEIWYYPKSDKEFEDIVINFIEHYTDDPPVKKVKKRKEFIYNPKILRGYRKNTSHMKDTDLMPYGKYKGEKMANLEASYLIWLFENNKAFGDVLKYIRANESNLRLEMTNSKKGIR